MALAKWMSFVIFLFFFSAVVQTVNAERRRGQGRCRGNRKPQPCEELYTVDEDGCCRPCKCRKGRGRPRGAKNPCAEECFKCERGRTYNDKFDFFCKPCQGCYDNRMVEQQCTRRRNRKCGEGCIPGYYRRLTYNKELEDNCVPCTKDNIHIRVCNLYFNSPLNRSTTKAPSSLIRNLPDINFRETYLSTESDIEDAATSTAGFKTETAATTLKHATTVKPTSTDFTVTQGLSANHSGKYMSVNGTCPIGSNEWVIAFLTTFTVVLCAAIAIILFACWCLKGKSPVELVQELCNHRETGPEDRQVSLTRVETQLSDNSQEKSSFPLARSRETDINAFSEENNRVTHSYKERQNCLEAVRDEGSDFLPPAILAASGTLSNSNNELDITSDETSHVQDTQDQQENDSVTHRKVAREQTPCTQDELHPLLAQNSLPQQDKPNESTGGNNKLFLVNNQQRDLVFIKAQLEVGFTAQGTQDDADLPLGMPASDDSNYAQAQQVQENPEKNEHTEQKTVV
ncbi:uncharacterized protein LOC106168366 [Lingula anatina]|uniref:Uncharacterized protein LOC106168366 n=1 Tax=Lingula anatina TaxID=7574 RepID=A0A1S3IZ79_LINAN|nr:uncharacterized protein LOC106168366 [Lingula anatina]|eukprot:XP_013402854.1 uncharacterized protein LOC106168366 [Lingula anatina]